MCKTKEDNKQFNTIVEGLNTCPSCSAHKPVGFLVCVWCYKQRRDIVAFKYWGGTLYEWIVKVVIPKNRSGVVDLPMPKRTKFDLLQYVEEAEEE